MSQRFVQVASAAQGGFSVRSLPAAVQYAGLLQELIVYYPNTAPPLTTAEGVTVSGDGSGNSAYAVVSFSGQNALSQDEPLDEGWILQELPEGSFPGEFTVEFYQKINNAEGDGQSRVYVDFGDDDGGFGVETVFPAYTPEQSGIEIRIFNNDNLDEIFQSASGQYVHCSIQRIGQSQIVFHYGGSSVFSTQDGFTGPMTFLQFGVTPNTTGGLDTALGQIRITAQALYGTGSFTPPSQPFFIP